MKQDYINNLSKEIHDHNLKVGWWSGEQQCVYQKLQLVSTEVAEATEGARKNLMDDHLPHYKMECVELADAMIRILDFGGRYGLEYTCTYAESPLMGAEVSAGSNHMGINIALTDFVKAWYSVHVLNKEDVNLNVFYSAMIDMVLNCAKYRGFNIAPALNDKLEYNKNRADHKKENREKQGGKSF